MFRITRGPSSGSFIQRLALYTVQYTHTHTQTHTHTHYGTPNLPNYNKCVAITTTTSISRDEIEPLL